MFLNAVSLEVPQQSSTKAWRRGSRKRMARMKAPSELVARMKVVALSGILTVWAGLGALLALKLVTAQAAGLNGSRTYLMKLSRASLPLGWKRVLPGKNRGGSACVAG